MFYTKEYIVIKKDGETVINRQAYSIFIPLQTPIMIPSLWRRYAAIVKNNCLHTVRYTNEITFWRNKLFVQIITNFLPFSYFVVVPGIVVSVVTGLYTLAAIDFLAFGIITYICFSKSLPLTIRKGLFIAVIYLAASALFYYLGSFGPGMLYFLIGSFFTALIYEGRAAYNSVLINAGICILFGIGFYFKIAVPPHYDIASWIAVSSNLIVLSFMIVVLMRRMFYSLSESNKRFNIVSKATSDIIWEWDILQGRMRYNSAMDKLLGYKKEDIEFTESWWNEKTHPEDRDRIINEFTKLFSSSESSLRLEYRILCADGSYKYVLNRCTVITEDGRPIRMVGAIQDVSEIRDYKSLK